MADAAETSSSTATTRSSNAPRSSRGRSRRPNNAPSKQNLTSSSTAAGETTSSVPDYESQRSRGNSNENRRGRANRRGVGRNVTGGGFQGRSQGNVGQGHETTSTSTSTSFHFNPAAVPFKPCCFPGESQASSAPNFPNALGSSETNQNRNRNRRGNLTNSGTPSFNSNRRNTNRGGNDRRVRNEGGRGRPRNARLQSSDYPVMSIEFANKPLRERLIYQLENEQYECAICYQKVKTKQGVWSCKTCYHIFHISSGCIIDWAKSSRDKEDDNKWRCPTCQSKNEKIPFNYLCFCGKQRNPTYKFGETAHGCGETCGGSRKHDCPHPCTELCHPGPCSECILQISKPCNCGKTTVVTKCGSGAPIMCNSVCGKQLSCGNHTCQQVCHQGDCDSCTNVFEQDCYCGEKPREVLCNPTINEKYSCGKECSGFFDCGVHKCNRKCHDKTNECGECARGVQRILNCPCGKKTLRQLGTTREKCTDPIPTCQSVCDKVLECGSSGKSHRCQAICHEGPCPPCQLNTSVTCRCKTTKRAIPCAEYLEVMRTTGEYICNKRCKKRKSCGLHKCQELCCNLEDHFCMQLCNKRLSCGLHTCENICHAGQCPRCLQADFDEQHCHCGKTKRLPPIACGSGLPPCSEKCARPHPCDHPVNHNCHGEVRCPPCTFLMSKMCYGGHALRKNIPCHIEAVSCGVQCGKQLKCSMHICTRSCHGDDCEKPGESCRKKCEILRDGCEHACALTCHGNTVCEPSLCRHTVKVTCECGRIKKKFPCHEVEKLLNSREEGLDGEKDETPKEGNLKRSSSLTQLNCITCDEECKKLERNRKVAEALDIEIDENGVSKLAPMITFPNYLKEMVKHNIEFVKTVESVFMDVLEQMSDPTKAQNLIRAHLPPMNLEKRRFIHEYAQYFNIETESVDSPPKRSILLSAVRGRSHQPMIFISELINFKEALNTTGPSVIRMDMIEDAKRSLQPKNEEEEAGAMKPLKSIERVVYRREPQQFKQVSAPAPVEQKNMFALLRNDDEDDVEDEKVDIPKKNAEEDAGTSPSKDWWSDDEQDNGEWHEVKPKEWIVEVEREIVEELDQASTENEAETETAGAGFEICEISAVNDRKVVEGMENMHIEDIVTSETYDADANCS